MTAREQRIIDKSWAKSFAEIIFSVIDESPYAVLYSDLDSRPNSLVNVTVGALIIKELTGSTDDEILESLMFDIRYQYALHTTHFEEQPLSDRTLGRFHERCRIYEEETGIDLIHETVVSLTDEMSKLMKIDRQLKRMDILMVASNIKKMSRLELLYTCVSNLVKRIVTIKMEIPENLQHYRQTEDRNIVFYHNRSDETQTRIDTVLKDASLLMKLCHCQFDESSEYMLLVRVLKEQTVKDEEGNYHLKEVGAEGLNGSILQNPSNPDATYREKAGKQYRGYIANVIEDTCENGSLVMDYQYEQNIHSDSPFTKETIEQLGQQTEKVTIVADGAFSGSNNKELDATNNIELVYTNLTGKASPDIYADFKFNENGTNVIQCAGGFSPKSCCYNAKNGQCVDSFERSQCDSCPFKKQCNTKLNKRTARKTISLNGKNRVQQQRYRSTDEFKKFSAFRNGVEMIPSILQENMI
ncbi:MAG: DDE transposase [Velocimicrobium sp.]